MKNDQLELLSVDECKKLIDCENIAHGTTSTTCFFIGDNIALLVTEEKKNFRSLQMKLNKAYNLGADVARISEFKQSGDSWYIVEERATGTELKDIIQSGEYPEDSKELADCSVSQFQQFFRTWIIAESVGLEIDDCPSNFKLHEGRITFYDLMDGKGIGGVNDIPKIYDNALIMLNADEESDNVYQKTVRDKLKQAWDELGLQNMDKKHMIVNNSKKYMQEINASLLI